MSRRISIVLSLVLAVGSAHAGDTLFTFDDGGLSSGDGDIKISLYMSEQYGSLMVVNGAEVHSGDGFGSDLYLWARAQLLNPGNIRMILLEPVNQVSFDGYVFDATSGADFTFTAYNLCGDIVYQKSWDAGAGDIGHVSTGTLPEMVYQLNFSDNGKHDIGIDNLQVGVVPVPGAMALGGLGVAFVGYLRRRRAM